MRDWIVAFVVMPTAALAQTVGQEALTCAFRDDPAGPLAGMANMITGLGVDGGLSAAAIARTAGRGGAA